MPLTSLNQQPNRKFRPAGAFRTTTDGSYHLLPFRFHAIDAEREVLVNEVGDYLFVPTGTAGRIVRREVSVEEPLFADLHGGFFITDQPIPALVDVLATRYRTKKAFLERTATLHILVPTLRCNHTCQYCQVSRQTEDRQGYDMSWHDLEAALDLIFKCSSEQITIEFQGGEPLLAFDKVTYAVIGALDRNRRHGKKLTFVLCTNLTVLTDEALDFCRAHDIIVSTSLDGPAFIHNANRLQSRSDSYDNVVQGLTRVRAALGVDRVSALMTTTRNSLPHPREIVDCYVANGFSHIFLRDISPFGFAKKGPIRNAYAVSDFLKFYKEAFDYIIELNQSGTHLVEVYASIIMRKILTPFNDGYVDLQSPAGLINSVVVYNYDGGVYASDESRMLAEVGDQRFRLGSVHDSYEHLFLGAIAVDISRHWANEGLAGCADCGLQSYCGADPVRHYATQADLEGYRPVSDYCGKNMEIIRYVLQKLADGGQPARVLRGWVV